MTSSPVSFGVPPHFPSVHDLTISYYYLLIHPLAQEDTARIRPLTKGDMAEFFKRYIHPNSPVRAKLAIHLVAQAKSDVSTKQISELIKTLDLGPEVSAQAATDLQARLSAAGHDEAKEIDGLKNYLLHDLNVAESKIDAAAEVWKKLHAQNSKTNGGENVGDDAPSNSNTPVMIEDVRAFKASLAASAGAQPAKDLSEYEDFDPKL